MHRCFRIAAILARRIHPRLHTAAILACRTPPHYQMAAILGRFTAPHYHMAACLARRTHRCSHTAACSCPTHLPPPAWPSPPPFAPMRIVVARRAAPHAHHTRFDDARAPVWVAPPVTAPHGASADHAYPHASAPHTRGGDDTHPPTHVHTSSPTMQPPDAYLPPGHSTYGYAPW